MVDFGPMYAGADFAFVLRAVVSAHTVRGLLGDAFREDQEIREGMLVSDRLADAVLHVEDLLFRVSLLLFFSMLVARVRHEFSSRRFTSSLFLSARRGPVPVHYRHISRVGAPCPRPQRCRRAHRMGRQRGVLLSAGVPPSDLPGAPGGRRTGRAGQHNFIRAAKPLNVLSDHYLWWKMGRSPVRAVDRSS